MYPGRLLILGRNVVSKLDLLAMVSCLKAMTYKGIIYGHTPPQAKMFWGPFFQKFDGF